MAEIWMVFGAEEYKYGTYRFTTCAEKNRVNNLAMKLREERGCVTYVKEILNAKSPLTLMIQSLRTKRQSGAETDKMSVWES